MNTLEPPMQISVIVVSYNVQYYLWQCLRSVFKAAQGLEAEVIVVDNNSKDGTLDMLAKEFPSRLFPQLHIIANPDNPGFGKANNQAFRLAKGEYVMCLNPDTFINEHLLKDCLDFMQSHPDAGCLGVKMLNADGSFAPESRRSIPTPWASFCKITRLGRLFPKSSIFGRYYLQQLPIDQPARIEIVSGACMIAKRKVVEEVGPFDEDFFMYCEDTDLAYRMLQAGYQNYYLPSQILHYKGESTRSNTYSYVNNFYKSIFIFFKKHYNAHITALRIPFYIAIYLLAAGSFIKRKCVASRYFISSHLFPRKIRLLVLGEYDNWESVKKTFTNKYDLVINTSKNPITDIKQLECLLSEFRPDYLVFNTQYYSYQSILNLSYLLTKDKRRSIALLYPQINLILTNLFVFNNE